MSTKILNVLTTALLIVILVFSCGVLHGGQPKNLMAAAQPVLPFTDTSSDNAWNGIIAYGLSGPGGGNDYLVIMYANGTIIDIRESTNSGYGVVKNIAQNTFLFQGEPQVDGAVTAPTYETHIWNVVSNTTIDFQNVIGHHDICYDPVDNTFLTFQSYVLNDTGVPYPWLMDRIVQLDASGNVIWSWDVSNYLPLSEYDNSSISNWNGQTLEDFSHNNALLWDYNDGIIYLNVRNTNTFYEINQTDGSIIWACGQFGNFTLLDQYGNVVPSLWYHGHDLEMVGPDTFTMFNNDLDNSTYYNDSSSQMIEFTLNEQTMVAQIIRSWTAPEQYYSQYLGATDLLPNGDWIGDFGAPTHRFPENELPNGTWDFTNTGADLIEVNSAGQIDRLISFPTGWSIYRIQLVTNVSPDAFNSSPSGERALVPVVDVSASSSNGPYIPQEAIDGIESTSDYWGTSASLGLPQWLMLDLGSATNISEVVTHFYDGDARVYTYYIEASVDGSSWTTIVSEKAGSGVMVDSFSAVMARYVRITVTGNTANSAAHIEEIGVYSTLVA